MGFWTQLFTQAWKNTWTLLGGGSLFSVIVAAIIFGVSFLVVKRIKGHESAKERLFDAAVGLSVVIAVGAVIFLFQLALFTPPQIYQAQADQIRIATNDVFTLAETNIRLAKERHQKEDIIQSNRNVFEIQTATIQSYQVENSRINRNLSEYESKRDMGVVAVKRRATDLANEIFDFNRRWVANEPRRSSSMEKVWGKGTTEELTKAFHEDSDRSRRYHGQMEIEFAKTFIARMSSVRDQLASLGFKSPLLDRLIAEDIRFRWDIQAAAEELQKLVEQMKD